MINFRVLIIHEPGKQDYNSKIFPKTEMKCTKRWTVFLEHHYTVHSRSVQTVLRQSILRKNVFTVKAYGLKLMQWMILDLDCSKFSRTSLFLFVSKNISEQRRMRSSRTEAKFDSQNGFRWKVSVKQKLMLRILEPGQEIL